MNSRFRRIVTIAVLGGMFAALLISALATGK
jgi:hypothetical protein